jgi:hypothetical protein
VIGKRILWALALLLPAGSGLAETPAYLGSAACTACHVDEAAAWTGSHHDLAWTLPGEAMLGDFDGVEFAHDGTLSRFTQEDGRYRIRVTENDGVTTDYEVHSVAGIAPLQQYLIDLGDGALQSFDVVWDVDEARWYHLYPDQDLPPSDALHWTGPYKNWNARCAECHATAYDKNYDLRTGAYASTEVEIGVGCEACHGPGEAHVAWASTQNYDAARFPGLTEAGLTIGFSADSAETEIQQCAGCHSRREAFGDGNPLPGTSYHDAYRLSPISPGLYHPDGTIRDEVYVYGSFLQSKMYANGVRCSDCHDVHRADLRTEGNATCTQCHSPAGNPRFPTLTKTEYDTPSHHFHPEGSEGAQCKSCHMVERVYMGVDWRRDHSFRVPRPDLAAETGAPDACTDCHTDQTPEWAAAEIAARFPDSNHRGPHFSQALARGWDDPQAARGALMAVAGDAAQPGIVRASALMAVAPVADPALAAQAARHLGDDDPLVRAAAVPIQRGAELPDRAARLVPLLSDPTAAVRMAAARELLGVSPQQLPSSEARALGAALGEWQQSLGNRADFPETHLVIGGAALVLRDVASAQRAFREAVTLDPQLAQEWVMLIRISAATGDMAGARAVAAEALARLPDDPSLRELAAQLQ